MCAYTCAMALVHEQPADLVHHQQLPGGLRAHRVSRAPLAHRRAALGRSLNRARVGMARPPQVRQLQREWLAWPLQALARLFDWLRIATQAQVMVDDKPLMLGALARSAWCLCPLVVRLCLLTRPACAGVSLVCGCRPVGHCRPRGCDDDWRCCVASRVCVCLC